MHWAVIAKTAFRAIVFAAVLGAVMLALAGTADWPGAWLFLAAMGVGGFAMETWLALNNPALHAERRNTKQPRSTSEKILLPLLHGTFFLWLLAMALDVRFKGTSQMPVWANGVGAAFILTCFIGNIGVFRANRFASAIVRIQDSQRVADQGFYSIVRHPMYGIAVFTYLAIPFALGSWRGLAGVPVLVLLLAIRTVFEERLLERNLSGYREYQQRVRYRFFPFVW